MNIERVARTLLGTAALCGLLVNAGCNAGLSSNNSGAPPGGTPVPNVKKPGDWGMSLLAGGTVGVGMVPAKFQFDASAPITASNCTSDYVAFNTSLAGGASLAFATQDGSVGATPFTAGDTITIANPTLGTTLTLTAGAVNSGTTFDGTGTQVANTANIVAAINRPGNGSSVGVAATNPFGFTVRVTAAAAGSSGNLITVSKTTVSATSFSWNSGLLAGGSGTASIVAFDQLYSSQSGSLPAGLCGTTGPSVDWAYYTGNGTAVTSVVLSEDGTKAAYVENIGGVATLQILKWKAGEGSSVGFPVAPTTTLIAGQDWTTFCAAANSCIRSIPFSGSPAPVDTKSAPFYVYRANDVLYVGDDNSHMHKFTGVFFGTPAEVTTAPWPIQVNPTLGKILTGPVYDSVSGNIFVGDSTGLLSFIRETGSTAGTCTPQPCLDTTNIHIGGAAGSIDDAPIVDGATGLVIAINSTDGTNFGTILQADTALANPVSLRIGGSGVGGNGSPIYSGAFDNTYFSSPSTGHMYVCGKARANRDRAAVYRLNFDGSGALIFEGANWLGGPSGDLVSDSGHACSPVTEFFNSTTGTDWIFFSVGNHIRSSNPVPIGVCSAGVEPLPFGCVMSVDVTNPSAAWPPAAANFGARTPGIDAGSTSGFVVDNVSASGQASSIYFTLGTNSVTAGPGLPSCNTTAGVGCAVKLTQSTLQ
jgi:hypothetical protein